MYQFSAPDNIVAPRTPLRPIIISAVASLDLADSR
jgi:hypothetical protein